MAPATSKLFKITASLLITCSLIWTIDGHAQAAKTTAKKAKGLPQKEALLPAETAAPMSGGPLKFNTDEAPSNKDVRSPLIFKDGANGGSPAPPQPSEMDNSVPEDAPFKTYLGYPKYQVGPLFALVGTSSIWKYGGVSYSFSSSSTAYGMAVRVLGTPQIKMEFEYQHYSVAVDSTTPGTIQYGDIVESDVNVDTYWLKNSFCLIGDSSFFRQLCPGFDIGYDAYPVLEFQDGTHMVIATTTEIILGVNLAYQIPFSDKFMTRFKIGYDYGTGVGNKGGLTSKKNMAYFASLAPEWSINRNHGITGNIEYKARQATIEGYKGSVKDKWDTDASTLSFGLGYLYTF